ncbi:MAG: hypothetical protein R2744_09215 [Bacteroidales bacterium]
MSTTKTMTTVPVTNSQVDKVLPAIRFVNPSSPVTVEKKIFRSGRRQPILRNGRISP